MLSDTRLRCVQEVVPAIRLATLLSHSFELPRVTVYARIAVMATRICAAAVLCVLAMTVLAARKHPPLLEDNALPKKPYRVTGTISVDQFIRIDYISYNNMIQRSM